MFLALRGRIHVLAGRLWDEVCPLRQGWMMMDRTQIWPEPGRDRRVVWRAADKSALQLLVTDGAIKCKRSLVCLIDRLWLGFCIFCCIWGVSRWLLATFPLYVCVWLHGHNTVHKQNLSGPRPSDTVHTNNHLPLYRYLVAGKARASVSGAPLYITTATSITTSLQNRCDKLPQKPALFLAVQCCCCCIFECWQLFRGLQDKGKPPEWEHFVFYHSQRVGDESR